MAWTIFYNPVPLSFYGQLWLLVPLCAGVAIIYKTVRVNDLRRLWREVLLLTAYMVGGLIALCAGLWLIQDYWP